MRMVFPHNSAGRWMDELATDMGTIVETLFGEAAEGVRRETSPSKAERTMSVPMDIDESDDAYLVTLDVPGVAIESIELDMHEDTLTVRGERVSKEAVSGKTSPIANASESDDAVAAVDPQPRDPQPRDPQPRRRERAFGRFQREVRLPHPVVNDSVTAEIADGVLVVTLPKADPDKGKRRVPVSRG